METLPFPEFIIIIIIIIIIIVIFVLDYFLYASMDQCHQRIPFQKTKNALNLIFKMLLCSSPGYLETCH